MPSDIISKYATTVSTDRDGYTVVTYHSTLIVRWKATQSGAVVVLDSGGWRTVTTKRKMNQAARQFGLAYSVFKRNGEWFLEINGGAPALFEDGAQFIANYERAPA